MNQSSDWFKVYLFGVTYSYADTAEIHEWYIKPTSPDTLYTFIPANFPYGVGFAVMTHLDSLNNESIWSNKAYFKMTFGPPVIVDLEVVH